MINAIVIVTAALVAAYLSLSKRLATAQSWQATVTPLASIMGSGFLVCAPLLAGVVGNLALVFMAMLLLLAYGVGAALRFNIRYFEAIENDGLGTAQAVAGLSRVVLAGAYFISVTYYLQLLSAFALKALDVDSEVLAHAITTVLLLLIGGIGMWRGLDILDRVEKYTVAVNLGMIAALIVALTFYNVRLLKEGSWVLAALSPTIDVHDIRVVIGLLIVVQGFETSRYLGDEFPAELRIATMRNAQLLSAAIYLVFIALATVLFRDGLGADVTAIITMTAPVAAVLPALLSITAMGSQFSAAVADDSGAGGLIEDISHHRVSVRSAYLLITVVTVSITWATNVNQIIAYASRAFALFYVFQCIVAFAVAWQKRDLARRGWRLVLFAFLAVMCLLVFAFGIPSG